jgi:hypothetical protein
MKKYGYEIIGLKVNYRKRVVISGFLSELK